MRSKVFVTGATGFIGGNIVEKLLEKGYSVKILIRDHGVETCHGMFLNNFSWKDKVEIIHGDILEPESFTNKINDCEIIIHSAALIAWWKRWWNKIYETNVTGTKNVLDAALKNNCKKFIHISSVAAIGYGENGEPINEEHSYNWAKHHIVYMETKHQAEEEVKKAIEKGLNASIVNPANVWGKGDFKGRRAKLLKVMKLGLPFYVEGGTNFVDVDAVVEAIINAIEYGKCGERYILGGENLKLRDFLNLICDELNIQKPFIRLSKFPISIFSYGQEIIAPIFNFQPRPTASQLCFFGKYICYDSSKARKELKMPFIPIKDTIRKSIRFYKEHNLL